MSDPDRGPNVDPEAVLTVFEEMDGPLYAWEVADQLSVTEDDVRVQLDDMAERGLVEGDDDFAPGQVWRLGDDDSAGAASGGSSDSSDGVDADPDDEETVTETEAQAVETGAETGAREAETVDSPPPGPQEEDVLEYEPPTSAIEAFDPPGTPDQAELRREALRHAYAYVRDRGQAGREQLVADVFPVAQGAYDSPDAGWWSEVVEPGLASIPGVERAGEEFSYVGRSEYAPEE
ncbi:hypothetical protein [Halomicrobium urmianum]|uniref:hypothetical protein n=1 Tax=Halomicrobium urmianum TaxID=1586233 RepID=UPI001CD98B5C|nr:hypothetical protein [Halomicrobium urmianum]